MTDSPAGMLRFNGTFTVTSPTGKRHTYDVRTVKGLGRRVGLLTGPDNTGDYAYFGTVIARRHAAHVAHAIVLFEACCPVGAVATTSRREWFEGAARSVPGRPAFGLLTSWQLHAATLADLDSPDGVLAARGFSVLVAGVCRRCNRKLTVPASIESGIGPECAGRENE